MRDIKQNPEIETPYECFGCGNIILAETSPDRCSECGGEMRNRCTPLE